MADIKLYSFNVRGLRDKLKRKIIFHHLKDKYPHGIYLLQETHSSLDIENEWKKQWGGDIYFSHGLTDSCGVAILISPDLNIDANVVCLDDGGRILVIELHNPEFEKLTIFNVYAPTRNRLHLQLEFLNEVKEYASKLDSCNMILGGDFNTIFDVKLDKQGGSQDNCINEYTKELVALMDTYDLTDAIRVQHADRKLFTRTQRKPPVLTRIDHWLISSHLINYMKTCNVYPSIKSDHSIIFLHISNVNQQRGRGFWKFNSTLLKDPEYVNNTNNLLETLKKDTEYMNDKQLRWDYIKTEVRSYTLQYSSKKNKEKKAHKLKLEKELDNIERQIQDGMTDANIESYHSIKEELEKIAEVEAKGAILRSKVKWAEAGEKNTKYFLNLERKNASAKHVYQLQMEDGNLTTDPKTILSEQRSFYENLYSKHIEEEPDISAPFNDNIVKLTSDEANSCEGLVTEQECANSLRNMKNGKSPGCDGFTTEFYKFFWTNIKTLIVESINYSFEKGELSIDQKRGIITLIPKKDKIRTLLKNWRPISLLNTDYKILTKCLAFRLHKVLPSLIDLDQTGFIKERYIGENIRTIADIIEYTSIKNNPGLILLLDFEKAFDTISWSFIFKSLSLFNFGSDFIRWIKIIYNNTESTVINNGHTAGFFKLHRGIRQGCPVSPYLFIIAVEVMANAIRNDKCIKGIHVGDVEIKISQLADDTTVFVSNTDSVKNTLNLIEQFYKISGLKLNVDKTIVKPIGSLSNQTFDEILNLKCSYDPIHTLGVTISSDPHVIYEKNFVHRLKSFDNVLSMWHARGLSLKGKVTILKSLALPIILYPMSVLPIPEKVVELVDNMILDFMWSQRKPKVKKNVIIQNIENGGLNVPCFANMVEANRISWIKRLLDDKASKWKHILSALVEPFSIQDFTENYLDEATIEKIPIPFYEQIYRLWNKARTEPKRIDEIMEQIIWNNKFIQVPAHPKSKLLKPIVWHDLYKAGIVKVKHLFDAKLQRVDLLQFCKDNNVKHNFLQVLQVQKAIPKSWVNMINCMSQQYNTVQLRGDANLQFIIGEGKLNISKMTTKKIYNNLILLKYERPTALNRWIETIQIDERDWPLIFTQPYICTRETKLQTFQYKILHRIIPCRKWLFVQKVIDSPYCTLCNGNNVDDIVHRFVECHRVKQFWISLEKWWETAFKYNIQLTKKHIIFGYYYDNVHFVKLNYIILLAKWYIQGQINMDHFFDFYDFLIVLKSHLITEKYVCTLNNQPHKFDNRWSDVLDLL